MTGIKSKIESLQFTLNMNMDIFFIKVRIEDVNEQLRKDLEATGATADLISAEIESSGLTGGLMDINDWIDQTLAVKGYIQAQEDREDFILRTGAGATKFNKWMKKAGLFFNKQTGRWTRNKPGR